MPAPDPRLKPCPHCGGEAMIEDVLTATGYKMVRCQRCWAKSRHCETTNDAIEAWNRRAEEKPHE